jgi:acyl-CoA thioesterase II
VTDTLGKLLDLLDLEQIELDIFRGRSPSDRRQRVFGGQVAGQALVAAGRTVPADRPVHSLHAYFIRPGDPAVPLVYIVDRVRDGRSFTTRRVSAIQHGQVIFTLSASFHHDEPGPDHSAPMPQAPPPESVPPHAERLEKAFGSEAARYFRDNPIDLRFVGPLSIEAQRDPSLRTDQSLVWLRADGDMPDDPLLHVCLMTYASDMTLLDSILLRHGLSWADGSTTGASLDHAMWFHRPFRADRWLLYAQESPSATGARGLARGQVFTQEGSLVVSVVQEGLIRTTPKPSLRRATPAASDSGATPCISRPPPALLTDVGVVRPKSPGATKTWRKTSCPVARPLHRLHPCPKSGPTTLRGRRCPR